MKFQQACDVLVVGGGFSGVAAAVSAARQGLNTVLLEKYAQLGGVATLAMHQSICGLYGSDACDAEDTLNDGFAREMVVSLLREPNTKGFERIGEVAVFSYEGQTLCQLLEKSVMSQANLKWYPETEVVKVETKEQGLQTVTFRSPGECAMLTPGCVIDCTGSGCVIELSKADYSLADISERQMAGYGLRLAGVKKSEAGIGLKVAYALAKAVEAGNLARHLKWSTWNSSTTVGEGILKLSVLPAVPPKSIEALQQDACRVHACLAGVLPEFKDSKVMQMGGALAQREGLRMTGDYTLTAEDVLGGKKFEDGVVKNAWPLEFWDAKKGPRYQYLQRGDYYEIPSRCLHSKSVPNLFTAGRCISVTSEALASTRVSGTCLSLGEQSAKAANAYLRGVTTVC